MCRSNFVVSVKDLRIAKLARSSRVLTCNAELDAYMAAVDRNGPDSRIVSKFANALTLCMNQKVRDYLIQIVLLYFTFMFIFCRVCLRNPLQ